MSTTLRSEDLVKIYKKRTVVNKTSVQVSKGEIVGLLGPNGAGKTTTFYMITGMIKPESGKVFLDDADITKVPMYKRARMGIGYLPQEASIFRTLSVEDNLLAVLEMTKLNVAQRKEKCESLLEELTISHIRKSLGFQLSGGERRRTEIARALATDPSFILLDEPFAGVDASTEKAIVALLHDLRKSGKTVLAVHHDLQTVPEYFDYVIMLNMRIVAMGPTHEVFTKENLQHTYGGRLTLLDEAAHAMARPENTIKP